MMAMSFTIVACAIPSLVLGSSEDVCSDGGACPLLSIRFDDPSFVRPQCVTPIRDGTHYPYKLTMSVCDPPDKWIKVSKRGGHVLQWEVSNLAIDAITSQDAELSVGLSSSGSALVSFADNYWTLNNGGNYCASRMCTSASDSSLIIQLATFKEGNITDCDVSFPPRLCDDVLPRTCCSKGWTLEPLTRRLENAAVAQGFLVR